MKSRLVCISFTYFFFYLALCGCASHSSSHQVLAQIPAVASPSAARLKRDTYTSEVMQTDRDYFVYLPKGYESSPNKTWPLLMFLHGNGERGNGKEGLDFVLMQGPLYEAWIQKKDLPFIIISPQLPMFGFDKKGIDYITYRSKNNIPQRLLTGVPPRPAPFNTEDPLIRRPSLTDMSKVAPLLPDGWERIEGDLITILDSVAKKYRVNSKQQYLSGLSYGGFGTWYMASKYPERFAAIAPVVGWGHPSLMPPIAQHKLPVWQFAGGRDSSVNITYFYAGLDTLEQLGHDNIRFTVHEDKGHDAWTRVYASDDLYQWLLSFQLSQPQ